MSDSNPTRTRYARNKAAFDDVIGDPFTPEPIDGAYIRLKQRSSIKLTNLDDTGPGSINSAKPLVNDFFCDVENAVTDVLDDKELEDRFWQTYLCDETVLSQTERNRLEQRLGHKFRARRLSPVAKYFIAVRRNAPRG